MPNERLDEVLNASNLLQIHPLQKFTPPSPPQSSEATETNQPTTNSQQQQQQQQSHPQLPSQEINPNPLPILLPPPYHEYAMNGESSLMTSLPGEPQIPSPLNRTPPPPYNPDQLNYVQPKNNLRRIQPRTKILTCPNMNGLETSL
ncbi:hypothetical protein O3M35_010573 [Rhynocoris fuscipes]|uniref:Uncharacterized protein n=1 Tax=Rhynocoris fuscipes TaxID=488301 RepID=A0AAW1D0S8_9HEMI